MPLYMGTNAPKGRVVRICTLRNLPRPSPSSSRADLHDLIQKASRAAKNSRFSPASPISDCETPNSHPYLHPGLIHLLPRFSTLSFPFVDSPLLLPGSKSCPPQKNLWYGFPRPSVQAGSLCYSRPLSAVRGLDSLIRSLFVDVSSSDRLEILPRVHPAVCRPRSDIGNFLPGISFSL
jgi:hypothetical protein